MHMHTHANTHKLTVQINVTGGFVVVVTVGVPVVKPPGHSPGEERPQAVHGLGGNDRDELWTEGVLQQSIIFIL